MFIALPTVGAVAALLAVPAQQAPDTTAPASEPIQAEQTLDRAQVTVLAEAVFEAADADGDDVVTEEEFVAQADAASAEPATAETSPVVAGDQTASRYLIAKFVEISGDDGEISVEELAAAYADDFDSADTNQDEVLEGAEIERFAALRRGEQVL
jgi:hypothetical protein